MAFYRIPYNAASDVTLRLVTAGSQDIKAAPTLAAGDFLVSTDFGATSNADNIPTVAPAAGKQLKWTVSAAEAKGKVVTLECSDAAGAEWEDNSIICFTEGHEDAFFPTPGPAIQCVIDAVEHLRGTHAVQGRTFYVDPTNGATHAAGARGGRDDPYATIQDCHDNAVTAWAHDQILVIAGNASAIETHTETLTITKATTQIRGPGADALIVTSAGAVSTITVSADGVGLSGFQVGTSGTGLSGVFVTGADYVRLDHIRCVGTYGAGIRLLNSDRFEIDDCRVESAGGDGSSHGVFIDGSSGAMVRGQLRRVYVASAADAGIALTTGASTDYIDIDECQVYDCPGSGVNVGASVANTTITNCRFGQNGGGVADNIVDAGSFTVQNGNFDTGDVVAPANVVSMDADTVTSSALAASAVTEIVTGMAPRLDRNADLIESQRAAHTHQGSEYFYVDPIGGDTIASGNDGSRALPLDTVTEALSLVTDSAHSVIFLVAGDAGSPTTLTEDVTIAKRYVQIRGPGRDFVWTRSGAGNTILVTADGVGLSGFQLETAAIGSGNGVRVSGADFARLEKLWVNDTQGSGVYLLDSSNAVIDKCNLEGSGVSGSGNGIELDPTAGSVLDTKIRRCHFSVVQGDAVRINSGTVDDVTIEGCEIHDSAGWGINNMGGATKVRAILNAYAANASGEVNGTVVRINDGDIPAKTLDEINTGATHNIVNSLGRQVRELAQGNTIRAGTAQAGALTTITLDAAASAVDKFYESALVTLAGGTGIGQSRIIYDYDGTTKIAKVSPEWLTNPDATSEFVITPALVHPEMSATSLLKGYAVAGASTTITLDADASAVDDYYNSQVVVLHHDGTAPAGQSRIITDYDGTTKIATVDRAWSTNPVANTVYEIVARLSHRPEDTDVVLTAAHDAGSWASSPGGVRTITITVNDAAPLPVPGVIVDIYNAANTVLVARVIDLDLDGIVAVNLDDGTYSVRLLKSGFTQDTNPETLVVTADAGVTYTGVSSIITTPPTAPNLCRVQGILRDVGGVVHANASITIYATVIQTIGTTTLSNRVITTVTGAAGEIDFEVEKTARAHVTSVDAGVNSFKLVPNLDNQRWEDWADI